MRPDERDLADELRGHLALSVKERIDRGEDAGAARRAALAELGDMPVVRDAMRRVWYGRGYDAVSALAQDVRIGWRSLLRARGLAAAVVATLALGIGANAAIVSVVRGVLLRPLVNRGEDRLVYIRQSAPGLGSANTTWSVPEMADLTSRATTIAAFGDFSTIDFTLLDLGAPRVVKAGVVGGSFFEVMGLRPVLGRLLDAGDDGPTAASVVVLTYRFWATVLASDPAIVGTVVRLDGHPATIVGVLEPSVPYPADTEIIANVVASPHHLGATMVTARTHRMTELFGRLAAGVSLEEARADLTAIHAAIVREHPEAYAATADVQVSVARLRDQITAPARPILIVLLLAAGVVFVIACANVANLILARSVHRESELAVRAALGASPGALRRTLLVESLLLCGAGAMLGVLLARPFVGVVAGFAARFSVRALDVTVDASLVWVGAGLAIAAAVLLAYIPRLPSPHAPAAWRGPRVSRRGPGDGGRMTSGTTRRLRLFAMTQIACSFVLLAGAATLLSALVALQRAPTGFDTGQVLAIDVPKALDTKSADAIAFVEEATRRIGALTGVVQVAAGNFVPWRDVERPLPTFPFSADGYALAARGEPPRARLRNVTPGFFATLGVPLLDGRDFTDQDVSGRELVVIVSQSVADRVAPHGRAVGQHVWWTEPMFGTPAPRRIVGVVADVDDERVVPGRAPMIYHPFRQMPFGDRLFVRAAGDPYALVPAVTQIIQGLSREQPVERAATLEDVRARVIGPDRVQAFVIAGFAGVALLIAVVGVAGVLAFSVSARTRELGVRLAIGSTPRQLLMGVLSEGAGIVAIGIVAGAGGGYLFARVAARHVADVQLPGALPVLAAAAVLMSAAVLAALLPAARAARVDVLQALRSE